MNRRIAVGSQAWINVYNVIDRAVEEGVDYGWTRAWEHIGEPKEIAQHAATVRATIADEVMGSLCEVLSFAPPGTDD